MAIYLSKVNTALSVHLRDTPGVPPVAWENDSYEPQVDTLYVAEHFMPASIEQVGYADGSTNICTGIYQIAIYAPTGIDRFEARAMTDLLTERFKRGTRLVFEDEAVRVDSVTVGTGMKSGDRYMVPISVNWRSHTK